MGGLSLGKALLHDEIVREIPALASLIQATPHRIPDIRDVPNTRLFARAFFSADPRGEGYLVRFPMRDGSVLEFVSGQNYWSDEEIAPCSEPIQPGWYRRFRCSRE
jgi:hypothetical protein